MKLVGSGHEIREAKVRGMEGVGGKDTILRLLLPDLDLFNAATAMEKRPD